MGELRDFGIGTQVLYIPVHLQPWYSKKYGHKIGDYLASEEYYSSCLSIPMFPGLSNDEIEYIIECVNTVIT